MNSLSAIFRGSLVRRLSILFIALGLVPMLLLSIVPAYLQDRTNRQTAEEARNSLERRAELDLNQMALTYAVHYDTVFRTKAETANMLAEYVSRRLSNQGVPHGALELPELLQLPSGWQAVGEQSDVGFLASPLAKRGDVFNQHQRAAWQATDLLKAVVDADPLIRSAFFITEEQTIWLYPNLFWENGQLVLPGDMESDLTDRPYYGKTEKTVWTSPYKDVDMVVTVAAPVYVDGEFFGMAGLDFLLTTLEEDILQTDVGEQGYMFLMGADGKLINMPQKASASILSTEDVSDQQELFNRTIYDVATPMVSQQLRDLDIEQKLSSESSYSAQIGTPSGPAYIAFARLDSAPWNVVLVEPVEEVTRVASQLSDKLAGVNQAKFWLSMITSLGFVIVVMIGGFVTLRSLALPIQALADGAERIREGDFGYQVAVPEGDNEMSQLTRTFNAMVTSVKGTLDENQKEFDAINQIADLANHYDDIRTTLTSALEIARQAADVDHLAFSLIRRHGETTLFAVSNDKVARNNWMATLNEPPLNDAIHQVIASRHQCIFSSSQETDDKEHHEPRQCILLPVISKEQLLGTLIACVSWQDEIHEQNRMFLSAVANHFATLVENIRLQHEARDLIVFEERCRLARDLHDSVTQSLFSISLTIEGLKSVCREEKDVMQILQDLSGEIGEVQREMRTLINELHPLDVEGEDLERSLHVRAASLQRSSGIDVTVRISGNAGSIPPFIAQNLSRIAQEALSNVAKHASAQKVELQLDIEPDVIRLKIIDDGKGFDPKIVAQRNIPNLGLVSMRERAELLEGSLQIRSEAGKGTVVTADIPLRNSGEGLSNE
jgi:signal transduction histidine kinase